MVVAADIVVSESETDSQLSIHFCLQNLLTNEQDHEKRTVIPFSVISDQKVFGQWTARARDSTRSHWKTADEEGFRHWQTMSYRCVLEYVKYK